MAENAEQLHAHMAELTQIDREYPYSCPHAPDDERACVDCVAGLLDALYTQLLVQQRRPEHGLGTRDSSGFVPRPTSGEITDPPEDPEGRFVTCNACDGEGGWDRGGFHDQCNQCLGSGRVEVVPEGRFPTKTKREFRMSVEEADALIDQQGKPAPTTRAFALHPRDTRKRPPGAKTAARIATKLYGWRK